MGAVIAIAIGLAVLINLLVARVRSWRRKRAGR
jgi:hypothetical protein